MASIPPKKFTLRAFKIANPSVTSPDSGILGLLEQILTPELTSGERRMPLNVDEPDRELLASYSWSGSRSFLFGMMLRVIPADNGGMISEELFNQPMITMNQVASSSSSESQYKDHFYFALDNNYLVTTLSGNINISRLQTYQNWLLESVRGTRLFEFTEMTKVPDGVPLSQLKEIQFVGGGSITTTRPTEGEQNISLSLKDLSSSVLRSVVCDTRSLDTILENRLIEARLLLKVKGKPKDMAEDEFHRVMGAIVTNVTNDDGLILRTKDGNKYTGAEIKVKKPVNVECIEANRIVEEQLKQEMERFLGDIQVEQ